MSEQKNRKLIPQQGGIFNDLATHLKLIFRLMADGRVNPLLKLLPVGTLLYLLIPEPIIGPVDDVLVIWLGSYLFVELCPQEIVQEHIDQLEQLASGAWKDDRSGGEVIEGEFWEKKD